MLQKKWNNTLIQRNFILKKYDEKIFWKRRFKRIVFIDTLYGGSFLRQFINIKHTVNNTLSIFVNTDRIIDRVGSPLETRKRVYTFIYIHSKWTDYSFQQKMLYNSEMVFRVLLIKTFRFVFTSTIYF